MVIVNRKGNKRPDGVKFVDFAETEEEAFALACSLSPGAWIDPPFREGGDRWEVWSLPDYRRRHPSGGRHLSVVPASRRAAWT